MSGTTSTTDVMERPSASIEPSSMSRLLRVASAHLESVGALAGFAGQVIRDIPRAVRLFPAETAKQTGDLIRQNALVLLFMLFMLGAMLGITGSFLLEGIGLDSYVSSLPVIAIMRGVGEIVFCWVLAAKYGCGIVAELGAMRISEEIDALEVMGVPSRPYLLSTRVFAALITLPPLFVTCLLTSFWASKLFFVNVLGTVSEGGFDTYLYLFQGPRDLIVAIT